MDLKGGKAPGGGQMAGPLVADRQGAAGTQRRGVSTVGAICECECGSRETVAEFGERHYQFPV